MWGEFVSLFYPRVCISCTSALNSSEDHLCLTCIIQLPRTNYHLDQYNKLYKRFRLTTKIQYALALMKYHRKGVAQKILKEIKYKSNQDLARHLGQLYGQELAMNGFMGKFDMIVPIPLHPNKMRRRGYNQSAILAEGMANALAIDYQPNALLRRVDTDTQTKKGKADRWMNTLQIFDLDNKLIIEGKNVLVIDDVITTGATVESAIEVIRQGNPASVSVCCLATGH